MVGWQGRRLFEIRSKPKNLIVEIEPKTELIKIAWKLRAD